MSKTLPDDAFYYFQIARHLVRGDGVTFDGLTATNGLHPLWLAVISPLFVFFPADPHLGVHLALTLATLLSVATAVFAYAITRRLTGDALAAAFTLVLYAFNPYVAMESMNGLETALGSFCFAVTAWYYIVSCEAPDTRQAVTLGAVAGVMILARTDNAFLLAAILLSIIWRQRSPAGLRRVLVVGGVAALVVAPWVAWCALIAGSPIQSSGLAVPFVLHGNIVPQAGTGSLLLWVFGATIAGIILSSRCAGLPWPPWPFLLMLIVVVVLSARSVSSLRRRLGRLNFVAATLVALLLFHSSWRLFPRSWYFVSAGFLSAIYLGVLSAHAHAALAGRRVVWALTTVAVIVVAGMNSVAFRDLWQQGLYQWQAEMLAAARWVGAHTTAADRVGAFNAGIVGYWNPDRTVINLDGVVNSAAFDAIRRRRLWGYVREVQIAYLVEYEKFLFATPADMRFSYAPYLGTSLAGRVSPVARIPGTLVQSDIVILKVNSDAPADGERPAG